MGQAIFQEEHEIFRDTFKKFLAKEIDCWCSGDRVCRFDVRLA